MNADSSVIEIKGIGEKTRDAFLKLHIETVGDLLRYYPRTYRQYPKAVRFSELEELSEGYYAILAQPVRQVTVKNGRMPVSLLTLSEGGKNLQLIWYHMPYVRSTLKKGSSFVFYGQVRHRNGRFTMEQPVIYTPEKYADMEMRLLPVYALTEGITNNLITKSVRTVMQEEILLTDYLPRGIAMQNGYCEYNYAIKQMHFPDTMEALAAARNRLVFDEFFLFIMGLQYHKELKSKDPNIFSFIPPSYVDELITGLPYELTGAQKRALMDIISDMTGEHLMQRLIQGDVGSGKTIVAFLAMAWVSASGYQSAIMAPTEVLARQHYENFCRLCSRLGVPAPVVLLTGSMTQRQKRDAYERMQLYPNAIIVGTHTLIQEKALYANLALVVTDEQHRFGVRQRDSFSEKGNNPHIIVMSATPIPRTLAIILYGALDISVIDEVPSRRL
ncbi:MAG: DEAD/DEAH box helicase, partial [Clostridiales bacterium]|nr:DEAD/DEAH box helicase [Clostridiales bacterium]